MIEDWLKKYSQLSIITLYFLFLAVFLEEIKIAVNSSASFSKGSTSSLFNSFSSIMNSNQKYDSSVSSKTMLNFEIKLALDCARQVARRLPDNWKQLMSHTGLAAPEYGYPNRFQAKPSPT